MTERANLGPVLANRTVGWLTVPLTAARAARLADFTVRTGISAEALASDLLDDAIFDMTPSAQSGAAEASARADKPSTASDVSSIGGSR